MVWLIVRAIEGIKPMGVYVNAGQARVGFTIIYNGQLWRIMEKDTVKPGKGGAYAQLKLRNILQGNQTEVRLRTEEKIERATLEQVKMEYLYEDPAGYCFMNTETYEQTFLSADYLGGALDYLVPNLVVTVEYHDGEPIGVGLPKVVELTVTETLPEMKTATVTGSGKPATLETGKVITVPQFIGVGEKVRVDTEEGCYIERAK